MVVKDAQMDIYSSLFTSYGSKNSKINRQKIDRNKLIYQVNSGGNKMKRKRKKEKYNKFG